MEVYLLETFDGDYTFQEMLFHAPDTDLWFTDDGFNGTIHVVSIRELCFEGSNADYNLTYLGML